MARRLPLLVNKICYAHDAWIIGGACIQETPKDYDIAVPFANWFGAAMLIPSEAQPNSFGGWKFTSEGFLVDIWPCDLAWLLQNHMVKDIWHPRTGAKFKRVENS